MGDGLAVGFLGVHAHVECHVAGTAAWLRELLAPVFDVGGTGIGGPGAVAVTIGAATEPIPLDGAASVPCFALDQEVVRLPAVERDGVTILDDEYFRAVYALGPGAVEVRFRQAPHHLRGASMRLLREVVLSRVDWSDRLQMHAAALAAGGRVVLLAGARGAGKTSVLAHAAASSGATLVANDRAVLTRTNSGWSVRGVPTLVRVRAGTIARLPSVFGARFVPGDGAPALHTLAELDGPTLVAPEPGAELVLSLAQLAALTGTALESGGPVACLALVRRSDAVDGYTVRALSAAEAEAAIAGARFGVATEPREVTVVERVVAGLDRPPTAGSAALVRRLAAEVPVREVTMGPGLLARADAALRLVGELADGG